MFVNRKDNKFKEIKLYNGRVGYFEDITTQTEKDWMKQLLAAGNNCFLPQPINYKPRVKTIVCLNY